jgi:Flp pilus assembly protein TadG
MPIKRFLQDRSGAVAPMFGLVLVPLVGLTGAAIDYSRANSVRTAMQASLDATALALSKDVGGLNGSQITQKASDYFKANFNRPEASGIVVSATYTAASSTLTVNGSGSIDTAFMKVMGISTIPINSTATVTWGMTKLRVAFALDNTGSMAQNNKIGALKTATHQILSTLQGLATNPGDVQVAIIPFSKNVNVGSNKYSANWIDWSDWDDNNGHDATTQTCTTTTGKNGKPKKKCTNSTTWVPDNHNTWNGCITDRDQDFDRGVAAPNPSDVSLPPSAASTLFPAEQYDACPVAMMALGYNWSGMNNLVDQMQPDGTTNQPIGLVWAWHALTTGAPLNAPAITDITTKQVIILLSDGLNTQDRWYGDGSNVSTQVDDRMYTSGGGAGTCKNIKDAGIEIYSIQVNVNSADPTSTVMKNCASKPENFFMLTTSGQIVDTFNQIGTQLAKLHLTQ